MPISKHKKSEIIKNISKGLDAKTAVFANFHGLTVSEATDLRQSLRAQGISYMVAKKTLTKKALEGKKIQGSLPELKGELALAWGEDEIAPAQKIAEFEKKFSGRISILGGIFGGEFKNREDMSEIAAIPPYQTLLGMFVNVINSPIQGLVIALSAIGEKKQ